MDAILIMQASVAADLLARQQQQHQKSCSLEILVQAFDDDDDDDNESHVKYPCAAPTPQKKTRHQRYASELYFADDDLTETTVDTDLSWHWSSIESLSFPGNSNNDPSPLPLRVRTYAMDQGDIECILLQSQSQQSMATSLASLSSFESISSYFDSTSTLPEWDNDDDDQSRISNHGIYDQDDASCFSNQVDDNDDKSK